MDNSSVTNVDRRLGDVLVTFADGHTYAFPHTFLYIYRLTYGRLMSAKLGEKAQEDGSN